MNDRVLEQAQSAYRAGDFSTAAQLFASAKDAAEISGQIDHLRGNALMRLGRAAEAAEAYADALRDAAYGHRGALLTNRGKALTAAGDLEGAVEAFTGATQDASYATPYKAQLGLGSALQKLGRAAEAGAAFRQAAIDGTNPAPAGALASLGDCFTALGRPADAIDSYRTALDFAGPRDDASAINAGLGTAYAAANRFPEAAEAFAAATADGVYRLTPEQQAAYDRVREAPLAASPAVGNGYTNGIDPLDPLGKSGSFMPDPSDTGFFDLPESEMVQRDRHEMKIRRKHRHTGLKVFIALLVILLLAAGGAAFALMKGVGFPSQQDVLTGLFEAASAGEDTSAYLASDLDESRASVIAASVPEGSVPTVEGLDADFMTSTATVKVALAKGGELTYSASFKREGLGWAVTDLATDFGDVDAATDGAAAPTTDDAATPAAGAADSAVPESGAAAQ